MADDNNKIDPLADIDFAAMGVQTPFEGDDPETPPAQDDPKKSAQPKPRDPAEPEDPESGDDPDPEDPDADEDPETDPEDPETPPSEDPEDPDQDDPDEGDDPPDEDKRVVDELIELVGFEDINPEDFDDSVEGLGKLIQTSAEKLAKQQWDSALEDYPDVKEYFDYVQNGGDPDKYHEVRGQMVDYETMTIEEDNEAQQETIVRKAFESDGYEKEEIDNIVDKYKAGGILKDQAELALKGLRREAKKQKDALTAQQAATRAEQEKQMQEFWENVETTLKETDQFKGITIPKAERNDFFDYISKPVKDGFSQRDLDVQELGLEEKIAIDYLVFKGFPLSELVDKKAATKAATDLRKRIKSGGDPKGRKTGHPKPPGKDGQASTTDLDLI